MAEFSKLYTTNKGRALLAKILAGTVVEIDFPRLAVSSKQYEVTDLEALEVLPDIQQTSLISRKEITSQAAIKLETSFTNEKLTVGYYMRTLGLYATDPDEGEILFAVCIETSGLCYMPPYNGLTISGAFITLVTEVGNAENVILEVNPAAIATIGNIKEIKALLEQHENREATDENGVHGLRVLNGVLQYKNAAGIWVDIAGGGDTPHQCEYVPESTVQEIVDGTFVPGTDPDPGDDTATEEDIDGIIDNIYPD